MRKKKIIIICGFIGIAVIISLGFLLASGHSSSGTVITSSNSINLSMKATYNPDKIPHGFELNNNIAIANKLGINNKKSTLFQASDSISVHQDLIKDGDFFGGAGGTIELTIGGSSHKLMIQSSRITHHILKNGQNLLTGSFESEMTVDEGDVISITVGFTGIVETKEQFVYVTVGTLVLPYGDDSFATPEIQDIIWSLANFEELTHLD